MASQDSMYSLRTMTEDQVNKIHVDSALTSLASYGLESQHEFESQTSLTKPAATSRKQNPAMKKVIAKLVKAQIKRQVPH